MARVHLRSPTHVSRHYERILRHAGAYRALAHGDSVHVRCCAVLEGRATTGEAQKQPICSGMAAGTPRKQKRTSSFVP